MDAFPILKGVFLPMKSSDLKVVAIILSIALFFTIITSNAVSIASVVILAKGGTAAPAQQQQQSTDVNQQQQNNNNYVDNSAQQQQQPGTVTPTPDATQPSGGNNTPNTPNTPTNKPADANDPIIADPLGAYQKAAKAINQTGAAGYTKKGWQSVEGALQLSKFGFLAGTLTDLIGGFMTPEAEAEEKVNAKGSDDAKNRMPPSDCSKSHVKSATAVKNGDVYTITIVMNDVVNPSYADTDGLVKMSKEFLDIKDVQDTVKNDATVSKVVSKLDGTINYQAYTITAKMNAKGEFIEITHYCVGDINADLTAVAVGDLSASGKLAFHAKYYDFKY